MSTHEAKIEAVLFDMGGVIVQLDALENVLGATSLAPDEIWEAWILSDAVQEFERGLCDVTSFADRLTKEMQLQGTAEQLIERFMHFPKGMYPGAVELARVTSAAVTTGILSNTNALHWEHQQDSDVIPGLFDRSYLSYELGLAKPHREIYDYVIADLGLPAEEILFLDDNQVNVDGARVTGMHSELVKGPEAAAEVLRAYNVIS